MVTTTQKHKTKMTNSPMSIQSLINERLERQKEVMVEGNKWFKYDCQINTFEKVQKEIEKRIKLLEKKKKDKQRKLDENISCADRFSPIKEIVLISNIGDLTGAIKELKKFHGNYNTKTQNENDH